MNMHGNKSVQGAISEMVSRTAYHLGLPKHYSASVSQRKQLWKFMRKWGRTKWCEYCGKNLTRRSRTLDHVIPRSKGGNGVKANLAVVCLDCNQKKKSRDLIFFLYSLKQS